jgi:acetyl esterase
VESGSSSIENPKSKIQNLPRPAPDVADCAYGPDPRNVLDLWRARGDRPAPLVAFIHGGGFRNGDKSGIRDTFLNGCLDAGFAVAAINYRLSHTATFPAPMLDGARAIQFLRHHAERWNLDAARVAAAGGSAGAGICLWLGFHDDLADPDNPDPVLRQSTRLSVLATFNGQCSYDPRFYAAHGLAPAGQCGFLDHFYGLTRDQFDTPEAQKLFEAASPINFLTPDDPPVFMFYKREATPMSQLPPPQNADPTIAVHHPILGQVLKERMEQMGIESILHWGVGEDATEMDAKIVRFFQRHFRAAGRG